MRLRIPKCVRVISLDAMDTLVTVKEPIGVTYARLASEFGVHAEPSVLSSRFGRVFKQLEAEHPCYGFDSIGPVAWWTRIVKGVFDEHPKDEQLFDSLGLRLYDHFATPEPWKLVDSKVAADLDRLRRYQLFVCVTSNFDSRLRTILHDFELLDAIDFIALSGEIGVAKPNPAIFDVLVDHFGLESPREILHIGDNPKKDYAAANDVGATGVLFSDGGDVPEGVAWISSLRELDRD